jgi:hypothetical protein
MKTEENKKREELNDEELNGVAGGYRFIRKPADTTQTES